jgi:hypothetical protein
MAYNRYYTQFEDENAWQYTLYIIPSNANVSTLLPDNPAFFDSTFTSIELPKDFLMRSMSIETELGEIPSGIVSQTMQMTLNLASLQGTANFDSLREQLLQGATSNGVGYNSIGEGRSQFNIFGQLNANYFRKFNVFILMVNDGSGIRPVFIGAQKYSAENELTVSKLSDILEFKVECFDIMRCIGESISHITFMDYMVEGKYRPPEAINYGDSFNEFSNVGKTKLGYYSIGYTDSKGNARSSVDRLINDYEFNVSTFERMRALLNDMFTQYMRGFTWNLSSSVSLPLPFGKAWKFFKPRANYATTPVDEVTKPAYISEIWKIPDGKDQLEPNLKGGAFFDSTAFGKFGNAYEILNSLIENSLEIYRLNYSHSAISGWFGVSYQSDYLRPDESSGIIFAQSNVYSEVKFKLFQETVKTSSVSCSTLQAEKDSKEFPYSEQSTSSDNSKDLEIIFHNLPCPTNRTGDGVGARNVINSGMIVWNNTTGVQKVDTTCQYNYSSSEFLKLNYEDIPASGENQVLGNDDKYVVAQIREQQTAGVPYTIAMGIVKALGSSKETELSFKTRHEICEYTDVGKSCIINMNDLNPLITKIYNANSGVGVITKHSLDVYSASVDLSVRMYT